MNFHFHSTSPDVTSRRFRTAVISRNGSIGFMLLRNIFSGILERIIAVNV